MRFVTVRFMKSEPRAESKLRRKMTGNLKAKRKFPHAWEFNPLTAERSADGARSCRDVGSRIPPGSVGKKSFSAGKPFSRFSLSRRRRVHQAIFEKGVAKIARARERVGAGELRRNARTFRERKREKDCLAMDVTNSWDERRVGSCRRYPVCLLRVFLSLCQRPPLSARRRSFSSLYTSRDKLFAECCDCEGIFSDSNPDYIWKCNRIKKSQMSLRGTWTFSPSEISYLQHAISRCRCVQ